MGPGTPWILRDGWTYHVPGCTKLLNQAHLGGGETGSEREGACLRSHSQEVGELGAHHRSPALTELTVQGGGADCALSSQVQMQPGREGCFLSPRLPSQQLCITAQE